MADEVKEVHHHDEHHGDHGAGGGMWVAVAIVVIVLIALVALFAGGAFERGGSDIDIDANVPIPSGGTDGGTQ